MIKAEKAKIIKTLNDMLIFSQEKSGRDADKRNSILKRIIELFTAGNSPVTFDKFIILYPPQKNREETLGTIRKFKSVDLKDFFDEFYRSEIGIVIPKKIWFKAGSFDIILKDNEHYSPNKAKMNNGYPKMRKNKVGKQQVYKVNIFLPEMTLAKRKQLRPFYDISAFFKKMKKNYPFQLPTTPRSNLKHWFSLIISLLFLLPLSIFICKAYFKDFISALQDQSIFSMAPKCLDILQRTEVAINKLTNPTTIGLGALGLTILSLLMYFGYKLIKGKASFLEVVSYNSRFAVFSLPLIVIAKIYLMNPLTTHPLLPTLFILIATITWFAYYVRTMNNMMQVGQLQGSAVLIGILALNLNITPYITGGTNEIPNDVQQRCNYELNTLNQNKYPTYSSYVEPNQSKASTFTPIP
jgi:hypothetical protein